MDLEPVCNAEKDKVLNVVSDLIKKHPLNTYIIGKAIRPWSGYKTQDDLALEGFFGVYEGPKKPVSKETINDYNEKILAFNKTLGVEPLAPMFEGESLQPEPTIEQDSVSSLTRYNNEG